MDSQEFEKQVKALQERVADVEAQFISLASKFQKRKSDTLKHVALAQLSSEEKTIRIGQINQWWDTHIPHDDWIYPLPHCWPEHAGLAQILFDSHVLWTHIYVHNTVSAHAAMDWHQRYLPWLEKLVHFPCEHRHLN